MKLRALLLLLSQWFGGSELVVAGVEEVVGMEEQEREVGFWSLEEEGEENESEWSMGDEEDEARTPVNAMVLDHGAVKTAD